MRATAALQIFKRGNSQASGAASSRAALPTGSDSSGVPPKFVIFTATVAAYVAIGDGAVTAAAGDKLVQPGDSWLAPTNGCTNWACLQVAAAGVVQCSPVENSGA